MGPPERHRGDGGWRSLRWPGIRPAEAEPRLAKVVLITVTHESSHAIDAFVDGVERLRAESDHDVASVVVDNASTDDTVARLRRRGVDPVTLADNLGWNAGNNRGLERCPGDTDFVLLVNPDVAVPSRALDALIGALDDAAVGAAAPWLRTGDSYRAGVAPSYGLADAFFGVFGLRRLRDGRLERRVRRHRSLTLPASAYPEGSCLLLRREVIDRVGPLDERFFVYFDDVDLARRLAALGLHPRLVGDAVVEERPGKGSRAAPGGSEEEERVARYLMHLAAELRYYDKWYGSSVARLIARWRRSVGLRLLDRRWRRRHGIAGLRARAVVVVDAFLSAPRRR